MHYRLYPVIFALLSVVVLTGCTGKAVTVEQRSAVMTDVNQKLESLLNSNPDATPQQIHALIANSPHLEATGVQGSCAWARFTDGRLWIIANNRKVDAVEEDTELDTELSQFARMDSDDATPRGLPKSTNIRLVKSLGTVFKTPADTIAGWLLANGYTGMESEGTIDDLKSVSNVGVFYMDAHGGEGENRSKISMFALWTGTERNAANEAKYAADLDDGSIAYFSAFHNKNAAGKKTIATHYCITAQFVTKYMTFTPNSFVFINACYSNDGGFKAACIAKNASVYAGWTLPSEDGPANKAGLYVFDRLLGGNNYQAEDPKQRPFNWKQLKDDMHAKGLDISHDPDEGDSELIFTQNTGDMGLLDPSIRELKPDDRKDQLKIEGSFGSDQTGAKVTVGGKQAGIVSWSDKEIICSLVRSGGGSMGDVVVEINGHKSNTVRLTSWRGKFIYTIHGPGSFLLTVTCNVHLRGDVHDFRTEPGKPPPPRDKTLYMAQDSTGNYTCDGTCSEDQQVWTWSGGGSLPPLPSLQKGDQKFSYIQGVIESGSPGNLKLMIDILDVIGITETWTDANGLPLAPPGRVGLVIDPQFYENMAGGDFTIKQRGIISDAYVIQGDQMGPLPIDDYFIGPEQSGRFKGDIKWETIVPEAGTAPDPNAAS